MRRFASLLIGCVASLAAASASADEVRPNEYPGRFVDRPLTLHGGGIRVDARYQHFDTTGFAASNQVAAGVGIGFTDRFELDISHNREGSYDLYDNGGFVYETSRNRGSFVDRYGDLYIAARVGFVDTSDFGLAFEGGVFLPLHDTSAWRFVAALPVRARLGNHFNLDVAPEVQVAFVDDGMGNRDPEFDLNIPVAGVVQLADIVWLAGNSGIFWANFDLDRFYLPLIFELGFTVKKGIAPIMDIEAQGGFPQLFIPSASDAVDSRTWLLRGNLRFYIQL